MQIFAFIVLIVLAISLTHFHNWIIRKTMEDFDGFPALVIVSIFYVVAMILIIRYIILWGYPLLTQ